MKVDPADAYYVSRHWFSAGIGVIYAIAFWSLYAQFPGLYGDDGLEPVAVYDARHGAHSTATTPVSSSRMSHWKLRNVPPVT